MSTLPSPGPTSTLRQSRLPWFALLVVLFFGGVALYHEFQQMSLARQAILGDAARQAAASRVTVAMLGCRRYEKDYFLNLSSASTREEYLTKWEGEWESLKVAADNLRGRLDANDTRRDVLYPEKLEEYRSQFLAVVNQIRASEITSAEEANQAMAPFKNGARALSRATDDLASESTWRALEAGDLLISRLSSSVVVVSFLTIMPGILIMLAFRRYSKSLVHYAEELGRREERERSARSQAQTAQHQAEQALEDAAAHKLALERSEHQLRALMNNIPGVTYRCLLDDDRTAIFISDGIEQLTGYVHASFKDGGTRTLASVIHPDDLAAINATMRDAVMRDHSYQVEYRIVRADGDIRHVWEQGQGSRLQRASAQEWTCEGVILDITDRKLAEAALRESKEEFERAARTDRLTNLPNRTLFLDRLQAALERARLGADYHFAVMFLDFDRFKMINDSLGHDAGDELLVQISQRLRDQLRCSDSLAGSVRGNCAGRIGGDEFVVLLDDLRQPEDAINVAERLLMAFAAPYQLCKQEVVSTVSIGLVLDGRKYARAEDVLRDADTAMYEAKHTGRGRCVVFDESMRQSMLRRIRLERDLRNAIKREQLSLAYQPIVSLSTGEVRSLEALLRWQHPEDGFVSPAEFIPIAEESHLIHELGAWVLQAGCQQMAEWIRELGPCAPRTLSMNLSRKQFARTDLLNVIQQAIEQAGVEPGRIQLEITEDAFATDEDSAIETMHSIKRMGVKLAIDDFGKGCSSFASLHRFPVDALKVDRSMMEEIDKSKDTAALVHSLAMLVHNLGITLIAEGIEEQAQLIALQELGCHFGQGYFFAKPMFIDETSRYLVQAQAAVLSTSGALAFANRWEEKLAKFEAFSAMDLDE